MQELLILSAGLKANQSEVNEFFMSTLQHTIDDFVSEANTTEDGESRLYHKPLKVLRALASTGPGNINAAQKLANAVAGIFSFLLFVIQQNINMEDSYIILYERIYIRNTDNCCV